MSTLFVLLVPPLIALFVIMVAAIWITNFLVENLVGKKHRWLEEIITSGEVPADWRAERFRRGSDRAQQREKAQRKAQKKRLNKLDTLIRYTQTTAMVADEETRQVMLARLAEVRADWLSRKPDEF